MSEIRKYLRDAIAAHPESGPHEVAAVAAGQVPADRLRACLAEAFVNEARMLIGESRRQSMDNTVSDSPKMRDRASWWSQMLTERVNVNGTWIALGDCTFDDLQTCIDDREKLINRVHGQIENYRRLQKLMIEHKAARVNDVPAQAKWTHK